MEELRNVQEALA